MVTHGVGTSESSNCRIMEYYHHRNQPSLYWRVRSISLFFQPCPNPSSVANIWRRKRTATCLRTVTQNMEYAQSYSLRSTGQLKSTRWGYKVTLDCCPADSTPGGVNCIRAVRIANTQMERLLQYAATAKTVNMNVFYAVFSDIYRAPFPIASQRCLPFRRPLSLIVSSFAPVDIPVAADKALYVYPV